MPQPPKKLARTPVSVTTEVHWDVLQSTISSCRDYWLTYCGKFYHSLLQEMSYEL